MTLDEAFGASPPLVPVIDNRTGEVLTFNPNFWSDLKPSDILATRDTIVGRRVIIIRGTEADDAYAMSKWQRRVQLAKALKDAGAPPKMPSYLNDE